MIHKHRDSGKGGDCHNKIIGLLKLIIENPADTWLHVDQLAGLAVQ